MNKAQIKAKKRRKEDRDSRKRSKWWLDLGSKNKGGKKNESSNF